MDIVMHEFPQIFSNSDTGGDVWDRKIGDNVWRNEGLFIDPLNRVI